jgi:uncharacterized protein with NRDE domain
MCTLVVKVEAGRYWVAANRDELRARPATGPHHWAGETFWAPKDEQAGGTWLGVTDSGMFVGVTNRFGAQRDEKRRSRGQLVVEALRARSAAELHQRLEPLKAHEFNAFHLLYTDGHGAYVTWCDGERVQQAALGDGLHVVTERSLGADDMGRTELVFARLALLPSWPEVKDLQEVMKIHEPAAPPAGTCVHLDQWGYGTRSSMILMNGRVWWAEGPPCVTPYIEVTAALAGTTR